MTAGRPHHRRYGSDSQSYAHYHLGQHRAGRHRRFQRWERAARQPMHSQYNPPSQCQKLRGIFRYQQKISRHLHPTTSRWISYPSVHTTSHLRRAWVASSDSRHADVCHSSVPGLQQAVAASQSHGPEIGHALERHRGAILHGNVAADQQGELVGDGEC